MKAIPRKLLNDTVIFTTKGSMDSWGVVTDGDPVTLNYVRLEKVRKNAFNSLGEAIEDKATLFFDCINSNPQVSFNKGDKITHEGQDFTIREIDILKATGDRIHHFEIALV